MLQSKTHKESRTHRNVIVDNKPRFSTITYRTMVAMSAVFLMILPFIGHKPAPLIKGEPPKPVVKSDKGKPLGGKVETYIPKHNVVLPDFAAIRDIKTKKKAFFSFLSPYVDAENRRLMDQNHWLNGIKAKYARTQTLSVKDETALQRLYKDYRIKHMTLSTGAAIDELLKCIDGLPKSLVLMQAANESAWGSSRFARLGLNFFGQWCYKKGCGVVPNGRSAGMKYEVEAFLSVADSVRSYFKNINTNTAYSLLREIRAQLRQNNMPLQAEILATGLLQYSARGDHYVKEISQMINYNERFVSD